MQERGELVAGTEPEAVAAALSAAYQGGVLPGSATGDRQILRVVLDTVAASYLVDSSTAAA